jgi:outer membrane protein
MVKLIFRILFLFAFFIGFCQNSKTVSVGILIDSYTDDSQSLFVQMQNEIVSVVGEDALISFSTVLENNLNIAAARKNYQTLLNGETDIILAFGTINNIVITEIKVHEKPTILFGAINSDLIDIDKNKESSGINNFTYLISSQSYRKDLESFKEIYDFKNVGILVDDFLPELVPLKETLDIIMSDLGVSYQIIPFAKITDIKNNVNDVDAVYLAGGFFLSDSEIKNLANFFIAKKLPSFTITNIEDVVNGILATNQAEENLTQFFRRIALNIDDIVNGINPSELPIFVDFNPNLTINYNTSQLVELPIKFSLVGSTDFVGDFDNVIYKKKYSLLDVMNETTSKNLSLQSEQQNVTLKKQDVKIAKSDYYPNVSASASGIYIDPKLAEISAGLNPEYKTKGDVNLTQTIFSEAANANIFVQKTLEKAQQKVYEEAELDVILNASIAYFNALILKSNVKIQAQNLDVTKKNLLIAKHNYEAGQSGKTDVLRFRSEEAQNTQVLVEAISQLEQSFHALNQLLNNPIDFEIDIEEAELEEGIFKNYNYQQIGDIIDNPLMRKDFISFLIEEAKINAPEISSLNYNLKATERILKLNSSGRFIPTLGLQGQYTRNFNQWGKGSTSDPALNSYYNIGLNLSIPIFQQNQQNINKQIAFIQKDQLNINLDDLRLNIERNVNDAVLEIINEITNIKLSNVSEETAKESLELTQTAYSSGAVTITQLIDDQRNYLQAKLSRSNATYNYLISSIQLERFIGRYFLLNTEAENQAFVQRFYEFILNKN